MTAGEVFGTLIGVVSDLLLFTWFTPILGKALDAGVQKTINTRIVALIGLWGLSFGGTNVKFLQDALNTDFEGYADRLFACVIVPMLLIAGLYALRFGRAYVRAIAVELGLAKARTT